MLVKELTIINFKSIKHFESDFSGSLVNVFIGSNGAGKSTILQALQILYSWFAARIRNPKGNGLLINYSDISKDASYCFLKITVEANGKVFSWQLYRQKSNFREKPAFKTNLQEMTEQASALASDAYGKEATWPLMSFYGVTRSISNPPLRIRKKHKLEAIDLYDKESLSSGANFNAFFYWFREKEDLENQIRANDDNTYRDSQLESVRRSINRVFSGFSGFRVNRRHKNFEISKDGQVFSFSELSDGEKCYLGLVMDVARRLAISNKAQNDALNGTNVILIDELDLHLHPQWQLNVLDKLRTAFPNCQFFITTHSPYILSGVDTRKDCLFKLSKGEAANVQQNPFGKKVDDLLLNDFDQPTLRNETITKLITEAWQCIKSRHVDKEKFADLMEKLRQAIPDDIELVRLDIAYKREEKKYAEK